MRTVALVVVYIHIGRGKKKKKDAKKEVEVRIAGTIGTRGPITQGLGFDILVPAHSDRR